MTTQAQMQTEQHAPDATPRYRSEREGRTGVYRSVPFEVVRWRSLNADGTPHENDRLGWTWNYYLYIHEAALPKRLHSEFNGLLKVYTLNGRRTHHVYRPPDVLTGLRWHGDITLFEKQGGADGVPIVWKVGCDYAHLFDMGRTYTMEDVTADACRTIDDLWDAIPDMRLRCSYNGGWYDRDDGVFTRDGEFVSFEGARQDYEWAMEHDARVAGEEAA